MLSTKVRERSTGKMKQMFLLAVLLVPVVALILGADSPDVWAEEHEIPFDDADIFFELNNTDGDLGIHALIDGDAWRRLVIEDPNGRRMLNIRVIGRLGKQGLTELAFESAEPTFDELDPEKFFRRFPEGEYEIEGLTLDWQELESVAELTHLLPAPVGNITVNGENVPDDCDEGPDAEVDDSTILIKWDPVTHSHPELGRINEEIEVVQYEVVVEHEDSGFLLSVELPPEEQPEVTIQIPDSVFQPGEEFKIEILTREDSGNRTAVESCFVVKE